MNENNSSFQKLPELEASNERLTLVVEYQANNLEEFVERLAELLENSKTISHHKKVVEIKQFKGSQIKKTLSWYVEGQKLVRCKEITSQDGHPDPTGPENEEAEGAEGAGEAYSLSLSKEKLLPVSPFKRIFVTIKSKIAMSNFLVLTLFIQGAIGIIFSILVFNEILPGTKLSNYFYSNNGSEFLILVTSVELLCYNAMKAEFSVSFSLGSLTEIHFKFLGKPNPMESTRSKRLIALKIVAWSITLIGFIIFIGISDRFFQK